PDMICILKQKSISALSGIPASWGVRDFQTDHFAANVFVRWNVNHSGLRTERNRRPVLSAPQRRTELRHLAGTRLSVGIDNWPSCFRVETLVHVLPYKRFAFDKTDFAAGPLEEPQISIASDVNQTFVGSAAALEIHQDRRRDFIPIPGFIRIVLKMTFDFSCGNVHCNRRRRVEIVSGPLVAHPGTAVAGTNKDKVRLGIIVWCDPNRSATVFPLIAAFRPRFAAGFAGRRD